jgi:hypothetical protein
MRIRPGAHVWRLSLGIIVTSLSSAGCAPAPDTARHSVEDYATDPPLRQDTLARCLADPGTLSKTPDCVNVKEAERRVSVGSLRELTPLDMQKKN